MHPIETLKIRLEDISVTFGKKEILKEIHFELEKKELVMLLGLNGSGKTTLMRILLGFQRADRGKVWYNKKELSQISIKERSKLFSYIPQTPQHFVDYTVFEFVLLGITPYLVLFETPKKEEYKAVKRVLEEFHLTEKAEQRMDTLSGGERQLVYFARARIQNTPWMVLDEPMASLDYLRQHEFMERLKRYRESYQQGIIITVHDPTYALMYADRVIILHNHKIQSIISRTEENFSSQLTEQLNYIYKNHLALEKNHAREFYYWKE